MIRVCQVAHRSTPIRIMLIQKSYFLRTVSRSFNTPASPAWLNQFNNNISANPAVSIPMYLCIRNGTWYALVALLTYQSIGGPEFAVGYLVSKVTSKFRQPINLSLAALLQKCFPILSHIKASSLLYVPVPQGESTVHNNNFISKLSVWAMAPLDKYGFSFYAASKFTVFLTIGSISMMIKHGIDMSAFLEGLGVSSTVQDVGGAAGLASLINVGLIPSQLYLLGRLTPHVNGMLTKHNQS